MGLEKYKKKRDFTKTPEPSGTHGEKTGHKLSFVIHKHHASHMHYDLRLELDGSLKSWAVPKGPSMDPSQKKLAIMVEDHPLDYRNFEGDIPEGNYGAGQVIIWDEGIYYVPGIGGTDETELVLRDSLYKGNIHFFLEGKKLHGSFHLIRLKRASKDNSWLLIKNRG